MGQSSKEFYEIVSRDDCRGLDYQDWLAITAGPTLPTKGNTPMNIYDSFPSKYLRCADLQGRTIRAQISNVATEQMGKDMRPVLYFAGKQKGLVINKTKAMLLADAWGPETHNWIGRDISLRPDKALFEGKVTDSIAVSPVYPTQQDEAKTAATPPAPPPQEWRQNAAPAQAPLRTGAPSQAAPEWPGEPAKDDGLGFDDSDLPF